MNRGRGQNQRGRGSNAHHGGRGGRGRGHSGQFHGNQRGGHSESFSHIHELPNAPSEGQDGYNPNLQGAAHSKLTNTIKNITQQYQKQPTQPKQEESKHQAHNNEFTSITAIKGILQKMVPSPLGYDRLVNQLVGHFAMSIKPNVSEIPDDRVIAQAIRIAIYIQLANTMQSQPSDGYLLKTVVHLPAKVAEVIHLLGEIHTQQGSVIYEYQDLWLRICAQAARSSDASQYVHAAGTTNIAVHQKKPFINGLTADTKWAQLSLVDKPHNKLGQANANQPRAGQNQNDVSEVATNMLKIQAAYHTVRFQPSQSGSTAQMVTRDGYSLSLVQDKNAIAGLQLGITQAVFEGEGFLVTSNISSAQRWRKLVQEDELK